MAGAYCRWAAHAWGDDPSVVPTSANAETVLPEPGPADDAPPAVPLQYGVASYPAPRFRDDTPSKSRPPGSPVSS